MESDPNPFPRIELFRAPEAVTRIAKFVLDRLYLDVPHVIEVEE